MKKILPLIALLSLLSTSGSPSARASVVPSSESAPFSLELEGQVLWQGRNDAAIPGDTGTRFSLRDILESPVAGLRLEATTRLSERHQLRGVFAPLTLKDTGNLNVPVQFQDVLFATGQPTEAVFKFNSYRLTYRYGFITEGDWTLFAGITGKIRDARISLSQNGTYREKVNVGVVPLLHLATSYRLAPEWLVEFETDALAAPQGRAEDLRFALRRQNLVPGLSAAAGYRILEGGADNKEVYTFALFHYLFVSLGYEF